MSRTILLDTGPLVALLDRRDRHHEWADAQISSLQPPLLTCEAVLAEACYLARHLPRGIETVLETLLCGMVAVEFDLNAESGTVAELVAQYASVPMSLADACLVRMAEQHAGSPILTIDSDFRIYRMHRRRSIPVLMPTGS